MDVEKLIERLRKNADFIECSIGGNRHADLYRDAADTIEHLKSENARLQGWLDNIYGVLYDLDGYNPDNAKQMTGLCNDVLMMVKKAMRGEPSRPSLEEAERQLGELASMTAERDAAVEQLHGQCNYCKHMDHWREGPCKGCVWFAAKEFIEGDYWEWIGSGKEAQ